MSRLIVLSAALTFTLPLMSGGEPPAPPRTQGLPAGSWAVEFSNGVKQVTEVRKDRSASVVEPQRTSPGKATDKGDQTIIRYDDDRVERWTRVGNRWVVEHWFPASELPNGTPVLGIAEEAQ